MPLKKCSENNKSGWKWGDSGKCFVGPDGKKKAIKQGISIEGPKKFSEMASEHEWEIEESEIEYVLECAYEAGASFAEGSCISIALLTNEGWTEEITEDNFVTPASEDYYEGYEGDDVEEWDIAANRPGLWENIRKKKEREGKKYRPAKPGDKDRPDPEAWKRAQSLLKKTVAEYEEGQMQREQLMKMHKQLMEIEEYLESVDFEDWTKDMISKSEVYIQNVYDFVKSQSADESYAAEYQGRKVTLNKPFRTPGGPKKSAVYTKNEKGNVVLVRFGDPNMKIKKSNPARRKSFRARHNCSNPGAKWKARYWSCKAW
ncbi:MAG: hypothetical protein HWN81_14000 [Candidatus Lokiarchaeota archaeon]|nr:hypothetical protein [Candidatus Lokiarchaeota archaeon]